jgi:hypothetical protein
VTARLLVLAVLLAPLPAAAGLQLPAGFTAQVYVTGEGFVYLARSGRRYLGGEAYDRWPVYRIPTGGARLTPDTETRYLYGPPLPNPRWPRRAAGESSSSRPSIGSGGSAPPGIGHIARCFRKPARLLWSSRDTNHLIQRASLTGHDSCSRAFSRSKGSNEEPQGARR